MVTLPRLTLLGLLLVTQISHAENWRIENQYLITTDSDDADQQAMFLGALRDSKTLGGRAGIWVGRWWFEEPAGTEAFDIFRFDYKRGLSKKTSINGRLEITENDLWSPVLGNITVIHVPGENWRFEGSAEKTWVDSVPGLRQKLGMNAYSVSADWRFADQWTLVGALLNLDIDDGNNRNGGIARLIYDIKSRPGMTLQTRSKWLGSDFDGAGYFSPEKLQEHLFMVGYNRPILQERWSVKILGGVGLQKYQVTSGSDRVRNDLYYLELGIRGWFDDHFGLEGKSYCSNAGGTNRDASDSDYRYCHLGLSLILSY